MLFLPPKIITRRTYVHTYNRLIWVWAIKIVPKMCTQLGDAQSDRKKRQRVRAFCLRACVHEPWRWTQLFH